jgi:hypothetical protein
MIETFLYINDFAYLSSETIGTGFINSLGSSLAAIVVESQWPHQIAQTLRDTETISSPSPSARQLLLLPLPPTWFKVWTNLVQFDPHTHQPDHT